MTINGESKLLGIVGDHIAYTLSPAMHNRAAELLKLNYVYLPFPMCEAAVADFLRSFWQIGGHGLNITTPYKQLVAKLVSAPGGALDSVNTLYRGGDGWLAASTDGPGFGLGLQRLGRELDSFKEIVMLGSGGAASGVLRHIATAMPTLAQCTVLRRNAANDEVLRRAVGKKAPLIFAALDISQLTAALKNKGEDTLLIQATSAPQRGADMRELVPALAGFSGVLVDLVYGKPSALYYAALAKNLLAQDGEAMLIEQARLSQKLWWGKAAAYEDMAAAIRGKSLTSSAH